MTGLTVSPGSRQAGSTPTMMLTHLAVEAVLGKAGSCSQLRRRRARTYTQQHQPARSLSAGTRYCLLL